MTYARMRDGAKLHYFHLGRGPTVVLLHGFAMPAALWLPNVAPLLHQYRFVLPNLRGFGPSHNLPLHTHLLEQHANDLHDLLAALGESQVLLAGLSMGACTAMQYQRRYGFGNIRAYLNIDQAPCVSNGPNWQHGLLGPDQAVGLARWANVLQQMEPYRGQPYKNIPAVYRKQMWAMLSDFCSYAFAHRGMRYATKLAQLERLMLQVAPTENWPVYLDCLNAYMHEDYDWRPSLKNVNIPMTAFIGMESKMYPAAGQLQFDQFVPHCQLIGFSDCGHVLPFEQPKKFHDNFSRFLNQHRQYAPRPIIDYPYPAASEIPAAVN